jgi:methylaspartate ammonia-lyase
MLAKPGMGVDEGIMVVRNEQGRTLAEISLRSER